MNKGLTKEDRLMSGIMKDFQMESPSAEFTDRVMEAVEPGQIRSAAWSRPLISTGGWIGIAIGLTVLILFVIFGGNTGTAGGSENIISNLPSVNIPRGFGLTAFFDRFHFDSPSLIWIFTAIGGLLLMAFVERTIEGIRRRYFFN